MARKQAYADFATNNGLTSDREMIRALAIQSMANTATVVPTGTADAQGIVATPGLRLLAFSVRETAGTPAVSEVVIRNGTADTHAEVGHTDVAANATKLVQLPAGGVPCEAGIFVERVTGENIVVLYTKTIV